MSLCPEFSDPLDVLRGRWRKIRGMKPGQHVETVIVSGCEASTDRLVWSNTMIVFAKERFANVWRCVRLICNARRCMYMCKVTEYNFV